MVNYFELSDEEKGFFYQEIDRILRELLVGVDEMEQYIKKEIAGADAAIEKAARVLSRNRRTGTGSSILKHLLFIISSAINPGITPVGSKRKKVDYELLSQQAQELYLNSNKVKRIAAPGFDNLRSILNELRKEIIGNDKAMDQVIRALPLDIDNDSLGPLDFLLALGKINKETHDDYYDCAVTSNYLINDAVRRMYENYRKTFGK